MKFSEKFTKGDNKKILKNFCWIVYNTCENVE